MFELMDREPLVEVSGGMPATTVEGRIDFEGKQSTPTYYYYYYYYYCYYRLHNRFSSLLLHTITAHTHLVDQLAVRAAPLHASNLNFFEVVVVVVVDYSYLAVDMDVSTILIIPSFDDLW